MSPELEIRKASATVRSDRSYPLADHLRAPLADMLDAVADIAVNLHAEPYAGTWQGRGLAIARAINEEVTDA